MRRTAWAFALGCWLLSAGLPRAEETPGVMIPVDGGKVYAETCGKGSKTILLLHDGVLHSAGYDGIWPLLCQHYRVVRFDRRGYGRSPTPTAAFSPADDAAAVMKAMGVTRASVLGASEGGAIAIRLAARYPEMVDKLVLVGPAINGLPVSDHFVKLSRDRAAALRKDGAGALAATDPYIAAPEHTEARARGAAILAANPQNILHRETLKPGPTARAMLPAVKAKTLILVGEHDAPDIEAWAGAAEALMPDARRVVVPDAGHMMYLENPAAFTEQVEAFVR